MIHIAAAVIIAAGKPAPSKKQVTSIVHGHNEYWGYRLSPGKFQTCEGKIITVSPSERSEPIDVSCGPDGFDEHALHPTPKPRRTHSPHR